MTTTPAPTDHDAIRVRHEVALRWLREGYSYDDDFNQAALLIRDDVPALLDELAEARRELDRQERAHGETIDDREACHEAADKLAEAIAAAAGVDIGEHSNMNDPWANALDAMPKLVAELANALSYREMYGKLDAATVQIQQDRDAAREELAKTRAELAVALPFLRDGALAEHHGKCGESSQWDIRRCEDAHCLERAHLLEDHGLLPKEWGAYLASPATTAEPADEPKADNWRAEQATECGRGVLGDWCQRPVNHDGDCSPKSRRLAQMRADEPKATRCPVLHEDGVTRCHDDAGHAGDEHGGTGPHGHKTWTAAG